MTEPKYNIGDTVWFSNIERKKKQAPCPDCLDTKKWQAISPAGEEYEIACPRCSMHYRSNAMLSLDYWEAEPAVEKLVICGVQTSNDRGVFRAEYMVDGRWCNDSGNIYKEEDLFESEEAATEQALLKCAETNDREKAKEREKKLQPPRISKAYCDYEFSNASLKSAETIRARGKYALGWLLDDIDWADTAGEVKEELKKRLDKISDEGGI